MENASKALLIGAGILFTVMVLSLLMIGYQQISSYYSAEHEATVIEQTTKFNSQFENYNQKNIRGTDMISLMNKVIDYNERLSYTEGTNYKRIEITIDLGNNSTLEQFKFSTTESGFSNVSIFTSSKITNVTDTGNPPNTVEESQRLDKQLITITDTINDLKDSRLNGGVENLSDTKLQALTSNISNIFLNIPNFDGSTPITEATTVPNINNLTTSTQENIVSSREKRNELIKNLLNINLTLNNFAVVNEMSTLNAIKKIALKYYQITQFKRAYFECTDAEYDKETGRMLKMNFKVKTNAGGTVIFN